MSDDNCTREGDILVCPCNISINGTFYPCWAPISNSTFPVENITCTPCPKGAFSTNKTVNCTNDKCHEGSCIEPYKCELCPSGQYANLTGRAHCTKCSAGHISRLPGAENCTACPPGYTSHEGATDCEGCPPGTYTPDYGSPLCRSCEPGHYSSGKAASCPMCKKGTYNEKIGQDNSGCLGCGVGHYSDTPGLTSKAGCMSCPESFYCPKEDTDAPISCPAGHYCPVGTGTPPHCPFLYTSDEGQPQCNAGAGFYIAIFASICVASLIFTVLWKLRQRSHDLRRVELQQAETSNLIPQPKDGTSYTGL